MNMSDNKGCPFCGSNYLVFIAENNIKHLIKCQGCGAQGPFSTMVDNLNLLHAHLRAAKLWNQRCHPEAEKIYKTLLELFPNFAVSGGFICQVDGMYPEITVLNFPNFDFQLKLFRDGSWEVETNGTVE